MEKNMRRTVKAAVIMVVLLVTTIFTGGSSWAGQWLWHHNEQIKGQVVEAGTLKPIEGALIIALWKLEDVVGGGPGGYEHVEVVESNREGLFIIPFWFSFKPWQLLYKISDNCPYILVFNPGFKSKFSNKPARDGHPDDTSSTEEEKQWIKEMNRLDPAKLEKITNDAERTKSLRLLELYAGFPDRHFSRKQLRKIMKLYETEVNNFDDSFSSKEQLLINITNDKKLFGIE